MSENYREQIITPNPTSTTTYEDYVNNVENTLSSLTNADVYKGDRGENVQAVSINIVDQPQSEQDFLYYNDFTEEGQKLLECIFNDIDPAEVFISGGDQEMLKKLNFFKEVDKYTWFCTDGNTDKKIFPSVSFVYIDSNAHVEDKSKEEYSDHSCLLTPKLVDRNGSSNIEYSKSDILPTFWYNPLIFNGRGGWCWKINGVETDIPASAANDANTYNNKLFLLKEDNENEGSYLYYIADDAGEIGWYYLEDLISWKRRIPGDGDLGYILEEQDVEVGEDQTEKINVLKIAVYTNSIWSPASIDTTGTASLIKYDEAFMNYVWNSMLFKGISAEEISIINKEHSEIQHKISGQYASNSGDEYQLRIEPDGDTTESKQTVYIKLYNKVIIEGSIEQGAPHSEGISVSHAEGDYSHAEGTSTAEGDYSHAEGVISHAEGDYSHAEGNNTTAEGYCSHAEGNNTTAEDKYSHAEGENSKAKGEGSHAEGNNTTAEGDYSHAEGDYSHAEGDYSHAEGSFTEAEGYCSHAEGLGTIAKGNYQTVIGKYNDFDERSDNDIFKVGCGEDETERKNAFVIDVEGTNRFETTTVFNSFNVIPPQAINVPANYNPHSYSSFINIEKSEVIVHNKHTFNNGESVNISLPSDPRPGTTITVRRSHEDGNIDCDITFFSVKYFEQFTTYGDKETIGGKDVAQSFIPHYYYDSDYSDTTFTWHVSNIWSLPSNQSECTNAPSWNMGSRVIDGYNPYIKFYFDGDMWRIELSQQAFIIDNIN